MKQKSHKSYVRIDTAIKIAAISTITLLLVPLIVQHI